MAGLVTQAGATCVALARTLAQKLRLRPEPDGWRHTVGVALRADAAKFALGTFGLKLPADPPAALAAFLQAEPAARYRMKHSTYVSERVPVPALDIALVTFTSAGELLRVDAPFLPQKHPLPAKAIRAYNRTRHLPEVERVHAVRADLADGSPEAERLLGASSLSLEAAAPGAERFRFAAFAHRKPLGDGAFHFELCSHADGTADLWTKAHHAAGDGAPLQEVVSRLEAAWGVGPTDYPPPETFLPPRLRSCAGERAVWESLSFLDWSPLTAYRTAHAPDVPLPALLIWLMAHADAFRGLKLSVTVDVPPTATRDRAVGLMPFRPEHYATAADFGRAFRERTELARRRADPVARRLQLTALLPTGFYSRALGEQAEEVRDVFGDACVSVVKDAKVIVAPMGQHGFPAGFFAVANLALPSPDGPVGAVCVTGTREQAAGHPHALQALLDGLSK